MPHISRRNFLQGTGFTLALPLLDAFRSPAFAAASSAENIPRRMVCICSNMGMMPEFFWPKGSGRDYQPSEYLSVIDEFRDDYTVFSGVSHPDVDGGHHAEVSYLTAAPHPAAGGFKNSISLDQYAAERVGVATRIPYLALNVGAENATLYALVDSIRRSHPGRPRLLRPTVSRNTCLASKNVSDVADTRTSFCRAVVRFFSLLRRICG